MFLVLQPVFITTSDAIDDVEDRIQNQQPASIRRSIAKRNTVEHETDCEKLLAPTSSWRHAGNIETLKWYCTVSFRGSI